MSIARDFKRWIRKILGITVREERKQKLKEFLKLSEETNKKFTKIHKDTLQACKYK